MGRGNGETAACNFSGIKAAQSCLHYSAFLLSPTPRLVLQTMKLAFDSVPVPLPSSCLPVLGYAANSHGAGSPGGASLMSCAGIRAEHQAFWLFACIALVCDKRRALGTLTQRHRMGKAGSVLLVRADGAGVSAERNLVVLEEHSYPGDFCTCSNTELVPALLLDPVHSGMRGVE